MTVFKIGSGFSGLLLGTKSAMIRFLMSNWGAAKPTPPRNSYFSAISGSWLLCKNSNISLPNWISSAVKGTGTSSQTARKVGLPSRIISFIVNI